MKMNIRYLLKVHGDRLHEHHYRDLKGNYVCVEGQCTVKSLRDSWTWLEQTASTSGHRSV